MKHLFYLIFIATTLWNCDGEKGNTQTEMTAPIRHNISTDMLSELKWFNEPESFEIMDSSLHVTVTKGTDFFNSPEDSSIADNAPYFYKQMTGDFVARALVKPDFNSQWNAVALMVQIDSLHWIKFAFENSDATGPSIVTVVTKGTSDDANGVILNEQTHVWLAIVKKK